MAATGSMGDGLICFLLEDRHLLICEIDDLRRPKTDKTKSPTSNTRLLMRNTLSVRSAHLLVEQCNAQYVSACGVCTFRISTI